MITERIDNITHVPFFAEEMPHPPSAKVELTSVCNYKCSFCAHRSGRHMDFELFKSIVDDLSNKGVKEIGLFYVGESMTHPRLVDAVKYAKSRFPYVFLTTNGSLATPKLVRELMEAGLDSLKFSLNFSGEKQFSEVTGMPAKTFYRVLENIKTAKKIRNEGYQTKLYASSILYNAEQIEKMQGLINELDLDEHYWLPLYSFGGYGKGMAGNPGRLGALRPELPCWAIFREAHVMVDGRLSACCFDASGKWAMQGWNSEDFKSLRRAHIGGDVHGTPCEECIYAAA